MQLNDDSVDYKNAFLMSQIKELVDVSYSLLKFAKSIDNGNNDLRSKKSVMLPRIGRSPVVFPRIGVQKKSAILKPRIGRGASFEDSETNSEFYAEEDVSAEKRGVEFQPRIGKK